METEVVRRRGGRTKGDVREEQILDAVRGLLAEKSMAAVTIDDIAGAAGISRTTFYFYFPTKQAVLTRLMEQVLDLFGQTHGWFSTMGPSPDALRESLAGAATVWWEHRPILACSMSDFGQDYPPLAEFLEAASNRFAGSLAAKIERDRAAGLAPPGIEALTLARMVEALRENRLNELANGSRAAAQEGLDELVEAILRLVYGRWA